MEGMAKVLGHCKGAGKFYFRERMEDMTNLIFEEERREDKVWLQGNLAMAVREKEEAEARDKKSLEENSHLADLVKKLEFEYVQKVDGLNSMLEDKDRLNMALTDSCNDLKLKMEGLVESAEKGVRAQEELERLKKDYEEVKRQIQGEREEHEKLQGQLKEQWQLALDRAVLEAERDRDRQIEQLKAERQAEVDRYQQKYFELLEKIE